MSPARVGARGRFGQLPLGQRRSAAAPGGAHLTDLSEVMVAAASGAVAGCRASTWPEAGRLRRPGLLSATARSTSSWRTTCRTTSPIPVGPLLHSPACCVPPASCWRRPTAVAPRCRGDVSRRARRAGLPSTSSTSSSAGRPEEILRTAFGSVTWRVHPSTMVCTDPAFVLEFIASSPAGQDAHPISGWRSKRRWQTSAQEGGQMIDHHRAGCFVPTDPLPRCGRPVPGRLISLRAMRRSHASPARTTPSPAMGCFHRPFISFRAPSWASSPPATTSFRWRSWALITSSAVSP